MRLSRFRVRRLFLLRLLRRHFLLHGLRLDLQRLLGRVVARLLGCLRGGYNRGSGRRDHARAQAREDLEQALHVHLLHVGRQVGDGRLQQRLHHLRAVLHELRVLAGDVHGGEQRVAHGLVGRLHLRRCMSTPLGSGVCQRRAALRA